MNQTTWTLAIHVATTLIIRQQTMASRLSLLGAVSRELGRSIRDRFIGQGYREQAALDFVRARAAASDAQSVLDALDALDALDRFSREPRFLMNLGERKGAILDGLEAKLPADARILGLGGYCGYSAVRMARLLGDGGQVVSIEDRSPVLRSGGASRAAPSATIWSVALADR